jgi:hypothetical protein
MTWVAVAIGGSALLGAGASIYGANKQSKAANAAAQQQMAMFQQTQGQLNPWVNFGAQGRNQLRGLMGLPSDDGSVAYNPDAALARRFGLSDFQQSPSYQWQLQQGQQAIDKGANARGNLYAPQTLQDLGKYQQGLASTDFNNAYNQYTNWQNQQYNQLMGVSGTGQNAAAGIGGFGANAASQAGQYQTAGAAAQAGGIMGATNALSGAGLGIAGYQQYLQGMQQPQYGSTPSYGMGNGAGQGLDPYGGGLGLTGGNGGSGLGLQLPAAYQ